jgi:hypothetical protein
MISNIDETENLARMQRGELYYAFSPDLVAARKRCGRIVSQLNRAGELSRRELAEYWREYAYNHFESATTMPYTTTMLIQSQNL